MYFFRVSKSPKLSIFFGFRVELNFRTPPSYVNGPPWDLYNHWLSVNPFSSICTAIGCHFYLYSHCLSVSPFSSICTATAYQSARSVLHIQPSVINQPLQYYLHSHWLSVSLSSSICARHGREHFFLKNLIDIPTFIGHST